MVLGAFLFATMGVCVKWASAHFNSLELVAYRGMVGAVCLGVVMRVRGVPMQTPVPMMHLWRSVVGVASLVAWFYAISQLPIATAMTLNYMSSIWIAAFLIGGAVLFQKSQTPLRQQGPLFLSVLAGFGGVALVLRPSMDAGQLMGGVAGLMSGLLAALAYLQVSALARTGEPDARTVFYFSLGAAFTGLLGMAIWGASPWTWDGAIWLLPIGLLAMGGQLCMTRSYASGATLVVANLQYFGIAFAGLYGLLVFGDNLSIYGWLGMGLIVGSGVTAPFLRERAMPRLPAEEHA